jgi:hypothetical protein
LIKHPLPAHQFVVRARLSDASPFQQKYPVKISNRIKALRTVSKSSNLRGPEATNVSDSNHRNTPPNPCQRFRKHLFCLNIQRRCRLIHRLGKNSLISGIDRNRCQNRKVSIVSIVLSILSQYLPYF